MKENKHGIPARFVGLVGDALWIARRAVRTQDELLPTAIILGIKDDKEGLIVVGGAFVTEDDKNRFAETVRQACSKYKAVGVVFMSEAWTVETTTEKEYREIRKKYGEIANHPDRKEVVHLSVETREGIWQGVVPIKKGRRLGRLNVMKPDRMGGRFAQFLPVVYATAEQVEAYLEMARQKLKAAGMDGDRVIVKESIISMVRRMARNAPADALVPETIDKFIGMLKPVHDAFYKSWGGI